MKVKKAVAAAICSVLFASMYAQNDSIYNIGVADFETFQTKLQIGDKDSAYLKLAECTNIFMDIVKMGTPSSPAYEGSRINLRQVHPHLENAAYYFTRMQDSKKALAFTFLYLEIPKLETFTGETFATDRNYPNLVYYAASESYNSGNFDKAVEYLNEYINTNDSIRRRDAMLYLMSACHLTHEESLRVQILYQALREYPDYYPFIVMAMQEAYNGGDYVMAQSYLDKALAQKPNEIELLNVQGKIYEQFNDYEKAIKIYEKLNAIKSDVLEINEHLSLCYYNLGVMNFNLAMHATKDNDVKLYKDVAESYFNRAVPLLRKVVDFEKKPVKYLIALASSYSCLQNKAGFDEINNRLIALGHSTVGQDETAVVINSEEKKVKQETFAQYVERETISRYKDWYRQGQFEEDIQYKKRTDDEGCREKMRSLLEEAETYYLSLYGKITDKKDFSLTQPYNVSAKTFTIESDMWGDFSLQVPNTKKQAEAFRDKWDDVKVSSPAYSVNSEGRLILSTMTFALPGNREYVYVNDDRTIYRPILSAVKNDVAKKIIVPTSSDVDRNIPSSRDINNNMFAVIISNEDYKYVDDVSFANNDGAIFREYCTKALGVPEAHIKTLYNASKNEMAHEIGWLKNVITSHPNSSAIVYYAGHGVPDPADKAAYMLPVDGFASDVAATGYSMEKMYKELGEMPADKVFVFIDACFSGAKRDGGMIERARGVALEVKKPKIQGNVVVLSAAQGTQTAHQDNNQHHGIFTYYLLKKLQTSRGNATIGDISDYVTAEVSRATSIKNIEQHPSLSHSDGILSGWENWKLK